MSFSLNRANLVRALVVVGLLYGSVHVLYTHQPDWTLDGLVSSDASPIDGSPVFGGPGEDVSVGQPWRSSVVDLQVESDEENAWKDHNARAHQALLQCRAKRTCTEHQEKVVILQDADYRLAYFGGPPGGEKIFARSVLTTFDSLGVTYFFSLGWDHLSFFYNLYPDLIRAAIMHRDDVRSCWEGDAEHVCLKTSLNPRGTPIQHIFSASFFGSFGEHPFGRDWTLTPEDYGNGDTYLGYSIEKECMKKEVPLHASKPRQVWVLAKYARYFTGPKSPLSNVTLLKAAEALNVEFVSAFHVDPDKAKDEPIPQGITNLGHGRMLPQKEFEDALVNTLAIVGLGDPIWSPTPWYGLCWSLPFLNPTWPHDYDDQIASQHNGAYKVGEPHVYNFIGNNDDAFIAALSKAIEPHDQRFIAPAMTQPEMDRRTLAWLEKDWKAFAEERIKEPEYAERLAGKDYLL